MAVQCFRIAGRGNIPAPTMTLTPRPGPFAQGEVTPPLEPPPVRPPHLAMVEAQASPVHTCPRDARGENRLAALYAQAPLGGVRGGRSKSRAMKLPAHHCPTAGLRRDGAARAWKRVK